MKFYQLKFPLKSRVNLEGVIDMNSMESNLGYRIIR